MCSCVEKNTKDLLINLKVLGSIGANYKLNTKGKYLELDDSTWFQWALRKYRGDTRHCSIEKVDKIIDETKHVVEDLLKDINNNETKTEYLGHNPKELLDILLKHIQGARTGIENLKNTYNYDTVSSSHFEVHSLILDKCIKDIQKQLVVVPDKQLLLEDKAASSDSKAPSSDSKAASSDSKNK